MEKGRFGYRSPTRRGILEKPSYVLLMERAGIVGLFGVRSSKWELGGCCSLTLIT